MPRGTSGTFTVTLLCPNPLCGEDAGEVLVSYYYDPGKDWGHWDTCYPAEGSQEAMGPMPSGECPSCGLDWDKAEVAFLTQAEQAPLPEGDEP